MAFVYALPLTLSSCKWLCVCDAIKHHWLAIPFSKFLQWLSDNAYRKCLSRRQQADKFSSIESTLAKVTLGHRRLCPWNFRAYNFHKFRAQTVARQRLKHSLSLTNSVDMHSLIVSASFLGKFDRSLQWDIHTPNTFLPRLLFYCAKIGVHLDMRTRFF